MTRNLLPRGVVAATLPFAASAAGNTRFANFFPEFGGTFARLRDEECAALWAIQQTEGLRTFDQTCNELLSCILDNTSEAIKANLASGTIALGLTPTILALLGSTPGETALLARRRPFLAFLLACGSPAVNALPTFVYENPLETLTARAGRLVPKRVIAAPPWQSALIVLAEYLLATAAISNVVTATYYIGLWTVNTISCDTIYMPILWAAISPAVHLCAMVALQLQADTIDDGDRKPLPGWSFGRVRSWFDDWLRNEFTPCAQQDKLVLLWKDETYAYVAVSWWTSFIATVLLLFGTIAFSSLVFLGYVDSIKIIGRLMGSAVICRVILMFELAGMRNALVKQHIHQPVDSVGDRDGCHDLTSDRQDIDLSYVGARSEEYSGHSENRRLVGYSQVHS